MKKFPVFCVAYVQVKGTTLPVYQMYHCKGFTILWKEHSTKNEKSILEFLICNAVICVILPVCCCWKWKSVGSNSLGPHGPYGPWNFPGQNTALGSLSLLQGTFPSQGLNPGLPHYRQNLYQLSHKGSPSSVVVWSLIHVWFFVTP